MSARFEVTVDGLTSSVLFDDREAVEAVRDFLERCGYDVEVRVVTMEVAR